MSTSIPGVWPFPLYIPSPIVGYGIPKGATSHYSIYRSTIIRRPNLRCMCLAEPRRSLCSPPCHPKFVLFRPDTRVSIFLCDSQSLGKCIPMPTYPPLVSLCRGVMSSCNHCRRPHEKNSAKILSSVDLHCHHVDQRCCARLSSLPNLFS